MNEERLVRDLLKVRGRRGIPWPRLDDVPALKEALSRHWPDADDAHHKHSLEDFLDRAASQLNDRDAHGIRLALGIGHLSRSSSADRRSDFAAHYESTKETVRRRGGLEDQAFTKLAKAILDLPPVSYPPAAPSGDQRVTTQTGGSPLRWPTADRSTVEHRSARPSTLTITSRARAYLVIESFEQDLRESIERFLLDHLAPEEVFSVEYDQLCQRRAPDDVSETGMLTQYLYPQQAYDVLLRHVVALPAELSEVLQLNLGTLDDFVAVRNRVMHGRPLQPDDLDDTQSFIGKFQSPYFLQIELALRQLALNSGWQPRRRFGSPPTERILHNLPNAEFNETGLLGRDQEINHIVSVVKRRRERMLTLVGEGGIGKTALALQVCYQLADDPEPPFEAILWTSLKSERLTPEGVQKLSNAIRDIDGATRELGQAIDHTFQGSTRELAETLGEMTTLIVVDNLETVGGDEVLRLYDELPDTVTFLFTSRRGVGQIERRISVGPLEEESAERLFRKFARSRGQNELADLPRPNVGNVLRQLRQSPLAIRWYILSVEAGKTPADTLRNQDELLRFCVANVINTLNSDAGLLLQVLQVLNRPVSLDELAVISEMEIDTLRSGAHDLLQRSLLVWSQFTSTDESELLELSSTGRAYLRTVTEPTVTEDVVRREAAYNQERGRERERVADHGRYLDLNVIYERSDSDAPTAHLLQQALRENKSGHAEVASATMARARALNPDYFEVDRVDAILASFRNETARSTAIFRSALSSCSNNEERSWVGYFFASLLARQAHDLPAAISWTEKAHASFNNYDTALQLGNFYVWDRRYAEGKQLIESALEQAPNKPRFDRIATTSLVECFRRWSEDSEASPPPAALDRALLGIQLGTELHDSGSTDEQLMRSIVQATVAALKAVRQTAALGPVEESRLVNALQRLAGDSRFSLLPPWRQLEKAVLSLSVEMRSRLAPGFIASVAAPVDPPEERMLGSVTSLDEKYGFIAHHDFPNNVFFHAGSLRVPAGMEDLEVGALVEFTPTKNRKGQDQALDVTLAGRDANTVPGNSEVHE